MFGFFATLLSAVGPAGFGSGLKMLAGFIDGFHQRALAREKRKLAGELARAEASRAFQETVFGNTEGGAFARGTRRIVAVGGVCVFAYCAVVGLWWPGAEIVTFTPAAANGGIVRIAWGLIEYPAAALPPTLSITAGHLPLLAMMDCSMLFGFYFTPGGSR